MILKWVNVSLKGLFLFSYGADVNAKALEDEKTSLHYAVLTGNLEIVQILVFNGAKGADVNAVSTVVGSALHLALTERIANQVEIVETLLRRGANPNAITQSDGRPCLKPPIGEYLQCCEHPRLEIIKLLLKHGARIVFDIQKNHEFGILKVIHRIHLGLNPEVMTLLVEASETFNIPFIEQSRHLSEYHKEILYKKLCNRLVFYKQQEYNSEELWVGVLQSLKQFEL
ncbi:uncharacterized protein CEXT_633871 [Caerostris extrusa]|uniref:Uncharacterized protein n=1 Tax=Caerostris extrusa TaxID=172846 RepID=A0AAV4W008_CAEEX|nr:uncharacterized protein CEXT_633871 [Caerostris extrusa]